jgi:signal transduction histidine kinase
MSARGEFGPDGRFIRNWSAIADVTAEKRADRDLRQAQRLDTVGQVTAGFAHDFNNLLTAILGNLERLSLHGMANPERSSRLIANAQAALQLFRRQRHIAAPVDVNIMITKDAGPPEGSAGGEIEVTFVPGKNLWPAMGDTAQIERGFEPRDQRPRRHAQRRQHHVADRKCSVQGAALPGESGAGDYVAISVSDTGSGIADNVRECTFEPLFTTKPTGWAFGPRSSSSPRSREATEWRHRRWLYRGDWHDLHVVSSLNEPNHRGAYCHGRAHGGDTTAVRSGGADRPCG